MTNIKEKVTSLKLDPEDFVYRNADPLKEE